MARIRSSSVYDFFAEKKDKFTCSIEKEGKLCVAEIAQSKSGGAPSGNLKRHLKRSHPDKFKDVEEKDDAAKRATHEKGQKTLTAFLPHSSVSVNILVKREDFKTGMLKMVAYDGVALTFFTNEGFTTINGTAAAKLNVHLGRKSVRAMVLDRAGKEKELLSKELQGKFFYLKFDGVTRLRSHYLGVTVQYWSEDGVKVKTLAYTRAHHDSRHLEDFVLEVMEVKP